MKRLRIDPLDVMAAIGLGLVAIAVGLRVGWDIAIGVVGAAVLLLAIALAAVRRGDTT